MKGALGNPHTSKGDGNDVRACLVRPIGAMINIVTFILHHHLNGVLAALRVFDDGCYVSCAGSYRDRPI